MGKSGFSVLSFGTTSALRVLGQGNICLCCCIRHILKPPKDSEQKTFMGHSKIDETKIVLERTETLKPEYNFKIEGSLQYLFLIVGATFAFLGCNYRLHKCQRQTVFLQPDI